MEYEKVLTARENPADNPFYERALLESARLKLDEGANEEALKRFQQLANLPAKDPDILAEAYARAGLLAASLDKAELSTELLDKLIKLEGDSEWKSFAKVGLIFNHFANEEYKEVIKLYETGAYKGPADQRPQMLLIVAHSYRNLDNLDAALDVYELVEKNYRKTTQGTEAAFAKLQVLYTKKDGGMPVFAQQFADDQRKIDPDVEYIDQALLMKAEWHFNQAQEAQSRGEAETATSEFGDAARAYAAIRDAKIDQKFHEARLYKQAWSEVESGDLQKGALTLSKFIQKYPKSEFAPSALAKRATTYQSEAVQDYGSALSDYQEIVEKYPNSGDLEYAMQQIALLHGHRREIPEMIAAYQALLAKFPKTTAAAEAHYWIGAGQFDTEEFEAAIESLKQARELKPKLYGAKASLRIILAHYQLENVSELAAESIAYLVKAEEISQAKTEDGDAQAALLPIPEQVLTYLGLKLFDQQDFDTSEKFLSEVCDFENPEKTEGRIWKRLGQAREEIDDLDGVIEAYNHYLDQTEKPSERAGAFLARGRAQLSLDQFENARESARECLRAQKEGRTNAEGRLLMGDVAFSDGDHAGAAREYLVLSQIYIDKELTPLALHKAALAYDQTGEGEKAAKLREDLKAEYPDFTPPKPDADENA
ncbi:MAG: tetratricopeptide repeat protein [Verrucomicrobiales bacterium]|nr:tetratricopeptide repeat protein [Verrucomicrobiales bacterium]